jgi:hypothetical protein
MNDQPLLKAIAEILRNDVTMMAALACHRETPVALTTDLRLRVELTIRLIDEIDAASARLNKVLVGTQAQGTSLTP